MMLGCKKCRTLGAWTLLILGILYLLADLNVFPWWNTISWYTALFIAIGIGSIGQTTCRDCQAIFDGMAGKRK